jgi:hypothetical protein
MKGLRRTTCSSVRTSVLPGVGPALKEGAFT